MVLLIKCSNIFFSLITFCFVRISQLEINVLLCEKYLYFCCVKIFTSMNQYTSSHYFLLKLFHENDSCGGNYPWHKKIHKYIWMMFSESNYFFFFLNKLYLHFMSCWGGWSIQYRFIIVLLHYFKESSLHNPIFLNQIS